MNKEEKNESASRESFTEYQPYLPSVRNSSPFFKGREFSQKTAGRFKSPNSSTDHLFLQIKQRVGEFVNLDGLYSFRNPNYPVPSQWREIFGYLYEEGVLISPYVWFEQFFHDEPKLWRLRLGAASIGHISDGNIPAHATYSRGVSENLEEALSKVTGELLERYPLTIYRRKNFIKSSYRTLKEKKRNPLDIFDLAGFADWQKKLFPTRHFDEHSTFHWAEGIELLSGESALIPAQLIFWTYNVKQEPSEALLRQPITNGAAGHFTRDEAIIAGIYENIQRDAFLIHWLNGIVPPRIDLGTIKEQRLRETIERLRRFGFDIMFVNTTLDLQAPSCACLFFDKTGIGPKIGVGGGCGPDLAEAMMRSISEATGIYHFTRLYHRSFMLPENYEPFRTPGIRQEERLTLWGNQEMFSKVKWFFEGPTQSFEEARGGYPESFKSSEEELEHLKGIFKKFGKGYEIYAYEAEHKILETLGYHSVRTIIPALVPLYLEETTAPLGASRLREVPRKMGYIATKEFYPWPHPFP